MCARNGDVLELVAVWGRGCPCHDQLRLQAIDEGHRTHHYRVKGYSDVAPRGVQHQLCPLSGSRAPQLVAEGITEVVSCLYEQTDLELWNETSHLEEQHRTALVEDSSTMREHITLQLTQKLMFWTVFPLLLCGLAHHNPLLVQVVAVRVLKHWAECEERGVTKHHSLTILFCDTFRHNVESLAAGILLATLGEDFQIIVARLRFVPTSELPVERMHAVVQNRLKTLKRKTSQVSVSLALRLPEIEWRCTDAAFMRDLAETMDLVRGPFGISSHLHFGSHPDLVGQCANLKSHRLWGKLLDVMYHTDLTRQYARHPELRKAMEEKTRRLKAAAQTFRKKKLHAKTRDDVVRRTAWQHFVDTMGPNAFYTRVLPAGAAGLPGVPSLSARMRWERQGDGQVPDDVDMVEDLQTNNNKTQHTNNTRAVPAAWLAGRQAPLPEILHDSCLERL